MSHHWDELTACHRRHPRRRRRPFRLRSRHRHQSRHRHRHRSRHRHRHRHQCSSQRQCPSQPASPRPPPPWRPPSPSRPHKMPVPCPVRRLLQSAAVALPGGGGGTPVGAAPPRPEGTSPTPAAVAASVTPGTDTPDTAGVPIAAAVGGAVGGAVVLVGIIVGGWFFTLRRRRPLRASPHARVSAVEPDAPCAQLAAGAAVFGGRVPSRTTAPSS